MALRFRPLWICASNVVSRSRSCCLHPILQAFQRPPLPPPQPLVDLMITYVSYQGHRTQASLNNGDVVGYRFLLHPDRVTTIRELKMRAKRRWRGRSIFFDKFSAGYEWLPEGWVGERRISPSRKKGWVNKSILKIIIYFIHAT